MIGMQYTIQLPADYNMNIIDERVQQNGHKTDGYPRLLFKAYLATVKGMHGQTTNSYCPLYVWNSQHGLNSFLLDGSYDAILQSFGWQQVQIGIPLELPLSTTTNKQSLDVASVHFDVTRLRQARYVIEYVGSIQPALSLHGLPHTIAQHLHTQGLPSLSLTSQGQLFIYNPDQWAYHQFYFVETVPAALPAYCKMYTILHWSFGEKE
ncbi:DUF4865 family protein [Paenibacillus sp. SGZ-1009]|uniref:DUF4865 family protein n=1 Tax=Paenibacillus campi TaxID=3106031 RepID=UPI002AFE8F51|nr:DUF4865 family protein [Paenibacillus sp. SGZ-1009]